ncbi:MAG: hypothetical protein ACXVHB_18490 [Solirubrobacteraceae bacterium]
MPELPFDEATRLDAIVGAFYDVQKEPSIAAHHVAVFVGGVSDADAIGLADDARLLIEAFVRDPPCFHRKTPRRAAAAPEPDGDLDIALHGLNLGPEDERLLAGLIRDLIQQRRAPRRTER